MKRLVAVLLTVFAIFPAVVGNAQTADPYDMESFYRVIDRHIIGSVTEYEFGEVFYQISSLDITEPDLTFSKLQSLCDGRYVLVMHEGKAVGAASFFLTDGRYRCMGFEEIKPYQISKLQSLGEGTVLITQQEYAAATPSGVYLLQRTFDPNTPDMTYEDYILCVSCENEKKNRGPRFVGDSNLGRYDAEDIAYAKRFWKYPQLYTARITSWHVYITLAGLTVGMVGIRWFVKHRKRRKQ